LVLVPDRRRHACRERDAVEQLECELGTRRYPTSLFRYWPVVGFLHRWIGMREPPQVPEERGEGEFVERAGVHPEFASDRGGDQASQAALAVALRVARLEEPDEEVGQCDDVDGRVGARRIPVGSGVASRLCGNGVRGAEGKELVEIGADRRGRGGL